MDNDFELDELTAAKFPNALDYIGLAATMVPFVFSVKTSSTTSSSTTKTAADGSTQIDTTTSYKYKDPIAIGGGVVGLLVAIGTALLWKKTLPAKRTARVALTVVLVMLGAFQLVVRGGLFS